MKITKLIISSAVAITVLSANAGFAADLNNSNEIQNSSTATFYPYANLNKASVALSAIAPGYCELNATTVHMSSSTPNNIAADATVRCALGTSIRISSMVVTLHKAGFINHYLTGPNYGGYADYWSSLYYSMFKTSCNSATSSIYWSTVHAVGVYSDGSPTSADAISPTVTLNCGTSF